MLSKWNPTEKSIENHEEPLPTQEKLQPISKIITHKIRSPMAEKVETQNLILTKSQNEEIVDASPNIPQDELFNSICDREVLRDNINSIKGRIAAMDYMHMDNNPMRNQLQNIIND